MIRLKVLGITFSQVQAGAYALVLAEETGKRRVPVIIGTPEAQSIAICLEGLKPPRPLTHDLFMSFAQEMDTILARVDIYRYDDGVFYSELVFLTNDREIRIDARTSDAIALAIRAQAPIYTSEEIMTQVGVISVDEDQLFDAIESPETEVVASNPTLDNMNAEALNTALEEAIANEDYEKASLIRDILRKKGS